MNNGNQVSEAREQKKTSATLPSVLKSILGFFFTSILTLIVFLSIPIGFLLIRPLIFPNMARDYAVSIANQFLLISLTLILLILLIFLLKNLFQIMKRSTAGKKLSLPATLALIIIAIFSPRLFTISIKQTLVEIMDFFSKSAKILMELTSVAGQNRDQVELLDFLNSAFLILIKFISSLFNNLSDAITSLPIKEFLILLSSWALLYFLITFIKDRFENDPESNKNLKNFLKKYQEKIILSLILIFAGFLSISAMITIPYLKEGESIVVLDAEDLTNRLNSQKLTKAQLEKQFPTTLVDSLAVPQEIQSFLNTSADSLQIILNKTIPSNIKETWNQLQSNAKLLLNELEYLNKGSVRAFESAEKSYLDLQENLLTDATKSFEQTAGLAFRPDEIINYSQRFSSWFSSTQNILRNQLEIAYQNVKEAEQYKSLTFELLKIRIRDFQSKIKQTPSNQLTIWDFDIDLSSYIVILRSGRQKLNSAPIYHLSFPALPSLPPPGFSWGPLGRISSWLLITRSYGIALLVGMLGFGLLGSAISFYVKRKTGAPVELSIGGGIIIKGLTAAVVIFLAVMGGPAIFGFDTANPNAYMLFFFCILAAVFSDQVWIWAAEQLTKYLNMDPSKTQKNKGELEKEKQK